MPDGPRGLVAAWLRFWIELPVMLWTWVALGILGMVLVPWLLLVVVFWAAEGSWNFEGRGLRYWLFVTGSRMDKLGLVEPASAPVRYSVSLQEGTFPGWRIATYESRAQPSAIVAAYAQRCRSLGFKVTEQTGNDARATLACEIEPYIDVEVGAERMVSTNSRVGLKVWGSR